MARMPFQDLRIERHDDVTCITLDRPKARNALTHRTYAELERAVRETTARCLVITGADPAFCSGDDVREVMKGGDGSVAQGLAREPRITPAADALLHTDVPVVAAVNGAAVGWGMELALMADLRVASERARFGELFVLRGLCCDVPGLARLASLVGRERAAELLYTGEIIDAEEALRIGLVGRVVPHEALLEEALDLAGRIAANPPLAVARLKAGLREALDPDFAALGRWVSASLGELFQTEDHREGVRAFLEKRPPRYVGR
jgi:enoyl-CoA hydratase/carnithine racemase